jgi:glycosyltransferase involved in cell wall biosynthesis
MAGVMKTGMVQKRVDLPIRVLGVVTSFEYNGAIVQLHRCLRRLDREKIHFTLCCMDGYGPLHPRFEELGIPIIVFRRRFRFDVSILVKLGWLMHSRKYDAIYTLKHTAAIWGRMAAILAGAGPIVTHEKGFPLPFTGWLTTFIDRLQSRRSELILANSEFTKLLVSQRLGVPPKRIAVLYNGLEEQKDEIETGDALHHIREIKQRRGVSLIGYIGRLSAEKGCDLFLRALPTILENRTGYEAIVCGDGFLREELNSLTRRLGLENRVSFIGWARDPVALIRELDVLVIPSLYESFCMLLLEAALAEIPVVATNVGGIPEINREVGIAFLVTPRVPLTGNGSGWIPMAGDRRLTPNLRYKGLMAVDPGDLAVSVSRLLDDQAMQARLVSGARRRALRRFSLEAHVRKFEDELLGVQSAHEP